IVLLRRGAPRPYTRAVMGWCWLRRGTPRPYIRRVMRRCLFRRGTPRPYTRAVMGRCLPRRGAPRPYICRRNYSYLYFTSILMIAAAFSTFSQAS
ncbi:MAG: hypothetical protein HDS16_05865, partial [Bacteroides sp.]|nr:hypothetical protein [Bacteroides sp.]